MSLWDRKPVAGLDNPLPTANINVLKAVNNLAAFYGHKPFLKNVETKLQDASDYDVYGDVVQYLESSLKMMLDGKYASIGRREHETVFVNHLANSGVGFTTADYAWVMEFRLWSFYQAYYTQHANYKTLEAQYKCDFVQPFDDLKTGEGGLTFVEDFDRFRQQPQWKERIAGCMSLLKKVLKNKDLTRKQAMYTNFMTTFRTCTKAYIAHLKKPKPLLVALLETLQPEPYQSAIITPEPSQEPSQEKPIASPSSSLPPSPVTARSVGASKKKTKVKRKEPSSPMSEDHDVASSRKKIKPNHQDKIARKGEQVNKTSKGKKKVIQASAPPLFDDADVVASLESSVIVNLAHLNSALGNETVNAIRTLDKKHKDGRLIRKFLKARSNVNNE